MRSSLFALLLSLLVSPLLAQKGDNMTFHSSWLPSIPGVVMNDIWGYHDSVQGEYAIIGSSWGTHFVNVTNRDSIYEVNSFIGGNTSATWRDFKTYSHFAFGVSDDGGSTLQIFDLQYLPDSVVKVYDNDSLSERTHNIHIFGDRLYLIDNKGTHPGGGNYRNSVGVVDISNPLLPRWLGVLDDPSYNAGHDVYVRNDTAFLSVMFSGSKAGLQVMDFTDPQNPVNIGSLTNYPDMGLNHASWGSEDKKTMVMADETHGAAVKVLDISDVGNIVVKSTFETHPNAIAHNPFILDDSLAILSYYHEGVQVWNIKDPSNPVHMGGYDTDTTIGNGGSYIGYLGCWGVYPFFPSRNLIASDRANGLYVLTMDWDTVSPPPPPNSLNESVQDEISYFPNPSKGDLTVSLGELEGKELDLEIYSPTGKLELSSTLNPAVQNLTLDISSLPKGIYIIRISGQRVDKRGKLILE